MSEQTLQTKCINTIRTLAIDAVQAANSGHPGTPMALAPLAYHLYDEVMKYNPTDPHWADRDRFVLSCGHASMLQYAILHMTGFDLSLDEIKNFRQWGSLTPGHPEVHHTAGIECTTGPLGQGISHAVGLALAEARLAAEFNTEDHTVVDHHTYVICSDGDLMEGVAAEACSLAGHMGLGKLICYYDDNDITIDGRTSISFTEDVRGRFESYGWQTLFVEDINDLGALRSATEQARALSTRPTMIIFKSIIGYGSPNKKDTSSAHGSPLGPEEIALTKHELGWPADAYFLVPEDVAEYMGKARERGAKAQDDWNDRFEAWAASNSEAAAQWTRRMKGDLPQGWKGHLPSFGPETGSLATRKSSLKVLDAMLGQLPELVGGSADLAGSNGTKLFHHGVMEAGAYDGQFVHFGIREHGMAAVCGGMSLHGGFRPFCATFMVFTDYMRPAMRLAALMNQPVVYIMTHDSIGLGEDGPTHQPVEHLSALRAIPNLHVYRPGDAEETREAWEVILERKEGPSVIVLTRQGVPTWDRAEVSPVSGVAKGAYVLKDSAETPQVILMGSGSETALALEAQEILAKQGVAARVVSVPCMDAFLDQDKSYRDQILPPGVRARVAVEAATSQSWHQLVGLDGEVVGMKGFGASAPASTLFEKFGITTQGVVDAAKRCIG